MKLKPFFALGLVLGLVLPALVPARVGAWPEPVEALISALQTGDAQAAAAALTADATLAIPVELLAPDSKLAPAGVRTPNTQQTFAGHAAVSAWLEEFLIQEQGRVWISGPAAVQGRVIRAPAWVDSPYLRALEIYGINGSIEMTFQGDEITALSLILPPAALQQLRRANPQIYAPRGGAGRATSNAYRQ